MDNMLWSVYDSADSEKEQFGWGGYGNTWIVNAFLNEVCPGFVIFTSSQSRSGWKLSQHHVDWVEWIMNDWKTAEWLCMFTHSTPTSIS